MNVWGLLKYKLVSGLELGVFLGGKEEILFHSLVAGQDISLVPCSVSCLVS